VEYKYKRRVPDGGMEWCITTFTVAEYKDGIPKTATMTIRSIESIMRENESNKRKTAASMLETMSDGFFIYKADGDEEFVYMNSKVLQIFGCKTMIEFRQLTSNCFPGMVHPEDVKRVQWEIHSQVNETERNMDYIRYRIIRKDGEVRWIEDVGHLEKSAYIEGSNVFYVFIQDATEEMTEAEKEYLISESKRFNK
jgi:PAS domain S-box-containing protein